MPQDMVGETIYAGRDGRSYPVPAWRALGFLNAPVQQLADGSEILYRVWTRAGKIRQGKEVDGDKCGRFFSNKVYRTRREAELHSNVMQYGNSIRHQTQYKVAKGTPMWVGKVFQGEPQHVTALNRVEGSQIFIDWEYHPGGLTEIGEVDLIDDMPGSDVIKRQDDIHRPLDS